MLEKYAVAQAILELEETEKYLAVYQNEDWEKTW